MRRRLGTLVGDRPVAYHPLLLSAFPVLALFAANLDEQVSPGAVLPPLAVAVGAAAVALVAGTLALGGAHRAALVVSAWVLLFFSYGHVWFLVRGEGPRDLAARENLLLGWWAVLAVGAVVLAVRLRRLAGITRVLNAVGLFLVAVNVATVGWGWIAGGTSAARAGEAVTLGPPRGGRPRDIYYIIMDRYGRAETLRSMFGFDNTPFLDGLRSRGFYIAEESAANYPKTAHSLAASLNMTYLDALTREAGRASDDWGPVYDLLRDSAVARTLQGAGYRYVHIGSRWEPTRIDPAADVNLVADDLSEFSQVLYQTTVAAPLARRLGLSAGLDPRERERRRTLFQFEQLARVPRDPRPTFTFAHILLPHEPYLFEADGGRVTEAEEAARTFQQNYLGQLRFANTELVDTVDGLLAGPAETDPIVILQADEGPHPIRYYYNQKAFRWPNATLAELREKLWILNAYYLPGTPDPGPYQGITPVNTFRLVLDGYFGAGLPLLPDRTYVYLDERHLYDFVEVTGRLRAGAG